MRTNGFLKAFWALTKPYWVSEKRGKGLALLASVVGLALDASTWRCSSTTGTTISTTRCENKDQAEFFRQLGQVRACSRSPGSSSRSTGCYFLQMLQIEWRTWLTDHFLERLDAGPGALPHAAPRPRHRQPGPAHRRRPAHLRRRTRCASRSGCSPRWSRWSRSSSSCGRCPGALELWGVDHSRLHGVGGAGLRRRRHACSRTSSAAR